MANNRMKLRHGSAEYKSQCILKKYEIVLKENLYFSDVLWIQLILLPWTLCIWIHFYVRWFWKFGIMKEEYGEEEKLYLIRKFLKLGQAQFDVSNFFFSINMQK